MLISKIVYICFAFLCYKYVQGVLKVPHIGFIFFNYNLDF